jgi:hypothetical protein
MPCPGTATGTSGTFFDFREQRFFLQGLLVGFFERSPRTKDQIDDETRGAEKKHDDGGKDVQKSILCTSTNIAASPENEA